MRQTDDTIEAQNRETVDVDLALALDALVGAWKESDGNSHVLALQHDDSVVEEYRVTWEVRDHGRHDDCVHVNDLFDYAYIEDGEVVEHTTNDTLEFGDETYNVHLW